MLTPVARVVITIENKNSKYSKSKNDYLIERYSQMISVFKGIKETSSSDRMEAAYSAVRFWAESAEAAGSLEADAVRDVCLCVWLPDTLPTTTVVLRVRTQYPGYQGCD